MKIVMQAVIVVVDLLVPMVRGHVLLDSSAPLALKEQFALCVRKELIITQEELRRGPNA